MKFQIMIHAIRNRRLRPCGPLAIYRPPIPIVFGGDGADDSGRVRTGWPTPALRVVDRRPMMGFASSGGRPGDDHHEGWRRGGPNGRALRCLGDDAGVEMPRTRVTS